METLAMSKVQNVEAVGDSGNDGTNGFLNIVDVDIQTLWASDGYLDVYVEFDMQIAVKTAAFAVRLPGTSHSPKDVKLELSNTGHTGPWSLAAEIQFFGTDRWQFFEIPTFAIGYRYARLFVVDSYASYNVRISEVEFCQHVVGTRVSPAVHQYPRGAVAGVSECN